MAGTANARSATGPSWVGAALDGNGAQLTFMHDLIKSVSVPVPPEETQSADSAKKN